MEGVRPNSRLRGRACVSLATMIALSVIALAACRPGPAESGTDLLVDSVVDQRIEGSALDDCDQRMSGRFVAAFSSSVDEVREIHRDYPRADLRDLPTRDVSRVVICISRVDGAALPYVATWIAWDSLGNSPSGGIAQFATS